MRMQHIFHKMETPESTGRPHCGKAGGLKPRDTLSPAIFHQHLIIEKPGGHLRITAPVYNLEVPIIVVRHGQTDGNLKRQLQGQIDEADHALNAVGREQIRLGAQRLYTALHELFGQQLSAMIESGRLVLLHSPLSRARDTAQAFINHIVEETGTRLSASVERRLSEMSFGVIEGRTIDEIAQDEELYNQILRYRAEDASVNWKGTGESYRDVVIRVHKLLESINTGYGGRKKVVIAFSHGITINALRTVFCDPAIVDDQGTVAFRKNILDNAESYWLGNSHQLAKRLK